MRRNLLNLIRIASGIFLLIIGIIGLLIPFLQGWLLIFIAIPLINPEYGKKMLAKLKQWKEKWKKSAE